MHGHIHMHACMQLAHLSESERRGEKRKKETERKRGCPARLQCPVHALTRCLSQAARAMSMVVAWFDLHTFQALAQTQGTPFQKELDILVNPGNIQNVVDDLEKRKKKWIVDQI